MKSLLFFILFFFSSLFATTQDINAMIREADRLESVPDEKGAFAAFQEVLKIRPTEVYTLSKCSELCNRIGKRQTDKKARENYYEAARIYATTAIRVDSLNSDANCAMAMALGHTTLSRNGKEKIVTAREIRKYVDRALKSNPNNFKAWHVLGRWHYEISNLNIFERAAVNLLYGGLPPSSIKDAIHAFERAQSITSGFVLNYFELARAYHRNDEDAKAVNALKIMLTMPNQTEDDSLLKADGKKMITRWR